MNTPHRFDLEESSCVNKEMKVFNRTLKKNNEEIQPYRGYGCEYK